MEDRQERHSVAFGPKHLSHPSEQGEQIPEALKRLREVQAESVMQDPLKKMKLALHERQDDELAPLQLSQVGWQARQVV